MTTSYVPGTTEKDPAKVIMAVQNIAGLQAANTTSIATNTAGIATNTTSIATNTTNIATNTANIATNTTNIGALQTKTTAYEAAWTTFTPTVTSGSGTFTTVSASGAYHTIGKFCHFTVTITITSAGTASGTVVCPLPTGTAKRPAMIIVGETANVGTTGVGRIATSATSMVIVRYDAGSLINTNNVLTCTGIYELA